MLIEYLHQHQPQFWMTTGFVILIVEVMLLGMATGVLLFTGLGALLTGLLMHLGLLPETWLAGLSSFGISSGVITAVLWQPLKWLQGERKAGKDGSSDLVGLEFVLAQSIDCDSPGKQRYSGIEWRVEVSHRSGVTSIAAGECVVVTSVDVGVFRVQPADTVSTMNE